MQRAVIVAKLDRGVMLIDGYQSVVTPKGLDRILSGGWKVIQMAPIFLPVWLEFVDEQRDCSGVLVVLQYLTVHKAEEAEKAQLLDEVLQESTRGLEVLRER